MCRVNTIIIGSAKCGTTSIAKLLQNHPDCCFSKKKEVDFFANDENFTKGIDWYHSFFPDFKNKRIVCEATPNYSDVTRNSETANRIYSYNPDIKLIYLVRNPIEKLVSVWKMNNRLRNEWAEKDFFKFLHTVDSEHHFKNACKFYFQLEAYLRYFDKNNILICYLEDLKTDYKDTVTRILDFLSLDPELIDTDKKITANKASQQGVVRPGYKRIANSPFISKIKRIIPSGFRRSIFLAIGRRHSFQDDITLPETDKAFLVNYFKEDSSTFLEYTGKPSNFWNLDTNKI